MAARKIKAKARKIAAYLLEVGEDDLEWNVDRWQVKGSPEQAKTIQEIAFAAYTNHPQGREAGLEAVSYYDPPNLTFPFGAYICVVDIDKDTGETAVRRFYALDDCGTRINPMVIEGQMHGGLASVRGSGSGHSSQADSRARSTPRRPVAPHCRPASSTPSAGDYGPTHERRSGSPRRTVQMSIFPRSPSTQRAR